MTGGHLMSDAVVSKIMPAPESASPSAGTLLRTAREAAGLHIKIDPEPVLKQLPQWKTAPLSVGGLAEPVRLDSRRGLRLAGSFSLPKPVLMISAALLLGAVVVLLLPSLRDSAVVPAKGDGEVTMVLPAALPLPGTAKAPMTAASDNAPIATPADAALAGAPVAAAAVPAAVADAAAIAVFSARESGWVQVVGADGVVHLRKTLSAGETVRINGSPPLSVVVGRANAIDVQVRGKPFELTPVAKDNVARFQIK